MPECQCLAALLLPAVHTCLHVRHSMLQSGHWPSRLVRLRITQSVSGGTAPKVSERWLALKLLKTMSRRTVGERGRASRYKLQPCAAVLCQVMSSLAFSSQTCSAALSHQKGLEGQITAEIVSRCLCAGAVKDANCGGSSPMIRYHFALTPSHLLLPSPSLLLFNVGMSATSRKCFAVIVFCERHSHVRHLALRRC